MIKETGSGGGITPSSDFENLKKEVEKLRTELSMLYSEHDALVFVECKNIETEYMLAVGALEYKAFELECGIMRLKRKLELIQASKNRMEKVNIPEINRHLNVEFAKYQAELNKRIDKVNAAMERSRCEIMNDADSAELKKLYRRIIKKLHPDLNPDLTEAQKTLFRRAVDAYESGDLNGLRIVYEMVADPVPVDGDTDGMEALIKEKERLSQLLNGIKKRITDVKSSFPYIMKGFVLNTEEIEAHKAELHQQIDTLTVFYGFYEKKIADALEGYDGGIE